jgi:hypothetical protein
VRVGFSVDMQIGDRPVLVFGLIDSAKRIRRTLFTRALRAHFSNTFSTKLCNGSIPLPAAACLFRLGTRS